MFFKEIWAKNIAGKNSLRFIVNSTVGILGIFDPASKIGLNSYEKEDFGQTLGSWGVGEGCYLVLPVLVHLQQEILLVL